MDHDQGFRMEKAIGFTPAKRPSLFRPHIVDYVMEKVSSLFIYYATGHGDLMKKFWEEW